MSIRSPLGLRHDGVLSIRPFRRLWIATSLSSLGDWLSLLALSALAYSLTGQHLQATAGSIAVSGVWITSLLPYLLFGPLAGAVADRLDRRINMVTGDVFRAVLYLSIPLNLMIGFAPKLGWIYAAQFLASCASLFWTPAKDASIPNLVPSDKLEEANQYSLLTTYGTAPVASLLFVMLAAISKGLAHMSGVFGKAEHGQVSLALYFNVATFVISAVTVYSLRELPRRHGGEPISVPSVAKSIWEGWRFAGQNLTVRGITIGMIGAFAAAGAVVGLGYGYVVNTLGGGPTGWGIVFTAIFLGLAAGMSVGVRLLGQFSRRRLFGLAIAVASIPLALIALIPNWVAVSFLLVLLGLCAGIAYVTAYTVIGREVDDDTRGRTFAFLQSAIRVIMFLVIALAPLFAAGLSAVVAGIDSGSATVGFGHVQYKAVGNNLVLLLAAVVAALLGVKSYRQMDDRTGVPLLPDLVGALRGRPLRHVPRPRSREGDRHDGEDGRRSSRGVLLAFEGGDGSGKSTQAPLLAIWLR